jgi:hypothetical protein
MKKMLKINSGAKLILARITASDSTKLKGYVLGAKSLLKAQDQKTGCALSVADTPMSKDRLIRTLNRELKQARRALEYYANHGDKRSQTKPGRARRVLTKMKYWSIV